MHCCESNPVWEKRSDMVEEFRLSVRETPIQQPADRCEKSAINKLLHPADVRTGGSPSADGQGRWAGLPSDVLKHFCNVALSFVKREHLASRLEFADDRVGFFVTERADFSAARFGSVLHAMVKVSILLPNSFCAGGLKLEDF